MEEFDDADVVAIYGVVYEADEADEADSPCQVFDVYQVMNDEGLERKFCCGMRQYWIQVEV